VVTETDLELGDGRTLHAYDTGGDDGRLAVFWHHGSPNIGSPPVPLFPAAERLGIRWVSYDRPGYGGSTPNPDRDVASAAGYTSAVADALGIDRFAVMGHSSGGSHALACAALLPERVLGVVSMAGLAPFGAEGLDWFEGFGPGGAAQLRSAAAGRAALEKHFAESDDEPGFTPKDEAALAGGWSWSSTSSVPPSPAAWGGSSTTISPASARGASTPPTSSPRPFSCTAAGIGSCPPRTASGSRAAAPRLSYGCARKTGTSRFSTIALRLWLGSGSTPKGTNSALQNPAGDKMVASKGAQTPASIPSFRACSDPPMHLKWRF
jgi:pimeloyl-ACP methyl ester carboxylesterase